MTKKEWLTAAITIIVSAASLVSAYWQLKAARAMANPAMKPDKKVRKFIAKIKDFVKANWGWIIGIGAPIFGVVRELRSAEVVSKVSLFFIFIYTVFLSVQLSVLFTILILQRLMSVFAKPVSEKTESSLTNADA
ncbi:MAG: hypothetical protein QOG00_3773 [Pyrinomonadaceae bacterium]|nr:hypothetical protein [Pyrinomonadaceae bacterium]